MADQQRQPGEIARSHGFLGAFERSVDAKGRLSLPFPFRASPSPADEEWILAPGPEGTLCLYPEAEWHDRMGRQFRQVLDPQVRSQLRAMSEQSHSIRPDGQGRISLPLEVLGRHEIRQTAVLVGMHHYLEIWSPERLAAKRAQAEPPSEDLLAKLYS